MEVFEMFIWGKEMWKARRDKERSCATISFMDFFKLKKFRNAQKPDAKNVDHDQPAREPEESRNGDCDVSGKSVHVDSTNAEMEDDNDDFITNEVKKRLKELKRNSFMVLIPEESSLVHEEDEEEEGGTGACEWRDVEAEGRQFWSGFDVVYDIYCERLLLFDRSSAQQLPEVGCQYTQLSQKLSSQPEISTSYNHSAQQYQQFQVLLKRFIENEPFEVGLRPEIYFRARNYLPKLLQVPKIQDMNGGNDKKCHGHI